MAVLVKNDCSCNIKECLPSCDVCLLGGLRYDVLCGSLGLSYISLPHHAVMTVKVDLSQSPFQRLVKPFVISSAREVYCSILRLHQEKKFQSPSRVRLQYWHFCRQRTKPLDFKLL